MNQNQIFNDDESRELISLSEEKKTVDIKLSAWADHLLSDVTSDIICVTAGYGSAKTYTSTMFLHDRIIYNPRTDCIWTEPTYRLIKDVAMGAFLDMYKSIGMLENVHFRVIKSTSGLAIRYPWGNRIHFLSADNPNSIVAYSNISACVGDEAGLCDKSLLKTLRERARAKKAVKTQVLIPSTPEGMNWLADEFDSDTQEGWISRKIQYGEVSIKRVQVKSITHPSKFITITKKRIRAETISNAHNLSEGYIENLYESYKHNQNFIDSYLLGYFRPFSEGLAYSNFKAILHKVKNIDPDPQKIMYLSWDFNIKPVWILAQKERIENVNFYKNADFTNSYTPPDGKGSAYDLLTVIDNGNSGNEYLVDCLVDFAYKYPVEKYGKTPIHIFGDMSGHAGSHKVEKGQSDYKVIKAKLNKLGYQHIVIMASVSNPLERHSVNAVQNAFYHNMLNICERCDMVLKSISRTSWKKGEQNKLDKPSGDTWTHPTDALKYLVHDLMYNKQNKLLSGR